MRVSEGVRGKEINRERRKRDRERAREKKREKRGEEEKEWGRDKIHTLSVLCTSCYSIYSVGLKEILLLINIIK